MMCRRGAIKTPVKGGKSLIVLIEYRGIAAFH